ncbi:MAG: 4Fe-4S dicluster domain-containing protein [Chloroflexi bacterium]|nr:4Fe-4S dicluster domain-containing protein [Chloroflexota bacterium]
MDSAADLEKIKECGVVGSGGAGFPTHVKLKAEVGTFIVNAAECEPLLHKDKELLKNYPDKIIDGLKTAMELVGAYEGIIGIKGKYKDVIDLLKPLLPHGVRIHPMRDFYPAGDEFTMVYEITGKVIPPGGLPLAVGVVVSNVETLYHIGLQKPVVSKFLTVAGYLENPVTFEVPVGVTIREVLYGAGVERPDDKTVLLGGAMMGKVAENLDTPVTKTLGGIIVLPVDHPLALKYTRTSGSSIRVGKAGCDQCSFCTELCPRYLLGHPLKPHIAMRSLVFNRQGTDPHMGSLYCCECNLCSLYACPEDLDPKLVCAESKKAIFDSGMRPENLGSPEAHPLVNERRAPLSRLMRKIGLHELTNKGPLTPYPIPVLKVTIPLSQHIGAPCEPVVVQGSQVVKGDLIGRVPEGKLGAPVHSSIDGMVSKVTKSAIVIERF